ncbi:polyhomeotic-like protein 2 [Lytechinus variegatus]|uniref:polyhomeotic-like protein 2 n=1 Tax=Lytechinus variegatus TaxID=7654 RepID=UPI001BB0DA80|nr:polyhomeotic-like protein 2 [Lytechinus variegatus]
MANPQANPQDLSSGRSTPSPVNLLFPIPMTTTADIPFAVASPLNTMPQVPATTVPATTVAPTMIAPSPTMNAGLVEGPLSAPNHKAVPPPPASPAGIHVPQRMTPSPQTSVANARSSPGGAPSKEGPKDAEGQRVIVTTRTPIFVRSYSHAQTTQSSPNTPTAPRMTAAAIRPTPTGHVMPTTAGMVQQVRPISSQVKPTRGHPRPGPGGTGRGNHGNKVRVLSNGPNRISNPQVLAQNRAQILARARSPGGLVIREHTPPSRSPPHAIRGQQPRIRIPMSGAGRGVSGSHSPVLITGTQIRAPFFQRGGTLLAYQPGNPRLQAALGGNHLAGQCVAMTSSGQFVVQQQTKMSPGNGQMSPRHVTNQVRHGLVSPNRARMPSTMPNPSSHSHHKPILPSPARTAGSHQLLTVANPQQHPHQAHRPTAQIRAHLPRISPRPVQGPVQAHSHHSVSDSSLHSTPDVTPMNLVTSPKGSPQIHPVDMSAKSSQSPSSTTIPTQSHLPVPSHHLMKSEGSDSDTSSKNGRFRVTSSATALSSTNPSTDPVLLSGQQEPVEGQQPVPDIIEHRPEVHVPREIPRAIVKPQILTHVIDGFIIEESKEPFPVTSGIPAEINTTYKTNAPEQQKLKRPAPEPLEAGGMLRCEFCGKVDSPRKFKRSKRFCSMACAKRYNVGCSKRLGLFSPRQPEKPEKTKHRLKLQLKAKPLKGQRGKHGRLTYNVAQPWSKGGQHENESQLPQETSSSSSSSSAPSEDMEHPSSPSPNVVLSSPSRSEQSFQYSDESDDLPPGVGRNPSSWSVENVAVFIRSLPGCAGYADEFQSQEIDGQALMLLKEDHLMTALNMKLGPALKIINKINTLKEK